MQGPRRPPTVKRERHQDFVLDLGDEEPVIGIDLGTTNSAVAAVQDGAPRVIPGRSGQPLTPSVVAVARNGKRLVGHMAKRQAITNAENTVFAAKRLIGRRWGSKEVEDARRMLPYALGPGPEGNDVRVTIGGRSFGIPEISAMVLRELKADAEAYFRRPVTRAVITVPASFNDGQRQATKDAGRIAGLEVLRIVNEPTSAALAYGFGKQIEKKVVVFDLGGGTFEISILDIGRSIYDVLATGGDPYLGGEDFDRRVMDWLTCSFAQENGGVDLRQDKMALQRLKDAAEHAKRELSIASDASIHLPFLVGGGDGRSALHLERQLTREKLEELTSDLVARCIQVTERTLRGADVRPSEIGEVILVGGMTRMPRVQRAVREFFGREPSCDVHPEEVVALGASIQAHALAHGQFEKMLERRESGELERRRARALDVAREIEALVPAVREAIACRRLGKDPIHKAEAVVARLREALGAQDPVVLATAEDHLYRTLQYLKSLAAGKAL